MNTEYKYQLAKRGKAFCPACERKTFVLYIDNTTGEPLHSTVGKCDRADNCGHHYSPRQYFKDNNIFFDKKEWKPAAQINEKEDMRINNMIKTKRQKKHIAVPKYNIDNRKREHL